MTFQSPLSMLHHNPDMEPCRQLLSSSVQVFLFSLSSVTVVYLARHHTTTIWTVDWHWMESGLHPYSKPTLLLTHFLLYNTSNSPHFLYSVFLIYLSVMITSSLFTYLVSLYATETFNRIKFWCISSSITPQSQHSNGPLWQSWAVSFGSTFIQIHTDTESCLYTVKSLPCVYPVTARLQDIHKAVIQLEAEVQPRHLIE